MAALLCYFEMVGKGSDLVALLTFLEFNLELLWLKLNDKRNMLIFINKKKLFFKGQLAKRSTCSKSRVNAVD